MALVVGPLALGKSEPSWQARRRLVVIRLCQQPEGHTIRFSPARQQLHAGGKEQIQERGGQGRGSLHIINNLPTSVVFKPHLEIVFLLGKNPSPDMPMIEWPNCLRENQSHCEHGNKEKHEVAISDPTVSQDNGHQSQNPKEKKESVGDKPLAEVLWVSLHHALQWSVP